MILMSLVVNFLCESCSILASDTRLSKVTGSNAVALSDFSKKSFLLTQHVAVAFVGIFPLAAKIQEYACSQHYPDAADVVALDLLQFTLTARNKYQGHAHFIVTGRTTYGTLTTFSFGSDSPSDKIEKTDADEDIHLISFGNEYSKDLTILLRKLNSLPSFTDGNIIQCIEQYIQYISTIDPTVGSRVYTIEITPE